PVFAVTSADRLCVLDSMYREIRTEPKSLTLFTLGPPGRAKRVHDDQVPTVLAPQLGRRYLEQPITVVRPPLQMWGGDLFTDGAGNGFTSTNTLVMNGGDE